MDIKCTVCGLMQYTVWGSHRAMVCDCGCKKFIILVLTDYDHHLIKLEREQQAAETS